MRKEDEGRIMNGGKKGRRKEGKKGKKERRRGGPSIFSRGAVQEYVLWMGATDLQDCPPYTQAPKGVEPCMYNFVG